MNNYVFEDKIGYGTFGNIFSAQDKVNNREVAIKEFKSELDDTIIMEVLRELSMCQEVKNKHPNIIQIYDIFSYSDSEDSDSETETDQESESSESDSESEKEERPKTKRNKYFMVMKKYQGDLHDYVEKDVITPKNKIYIAYKLLSVVEFLHENNIIHRDIKLNNIFINEPLSETGMYEPVLGDFGAAKYFNTLKNEIKPTHTEHVYTKTYRSPEVVAKKRYGLVSDEWSLGIVLYELFNSKIIRINSDAKLLKFIDIYVRNFCEENDPETGKLISGLLTKPASKRMSAKIALNLPLFKEMTPIKYENTKVIHWPSEEKINKIVNPKDISRKSNEKFYSKVDWKFEFLINKMFGEKIYDLYEHTHSIDKEDEEEEYIKYEKNMFEENKNNLYDWYRSLI